MRDGRTECGCVRAACGRTGQWSSAVAATLLAVPVPGGEQQHEWTGAQRRVGQLVLDNFLDEDMGATLGEWPTAARLADGQCSGSQGEGQGVQAGCWDYHVERLMKANKADKGHWSRDLHDRLAAARKQEKFVAHLEL